MFTLDGFLGLIFLLECFLLVGAMVLSACFLSKLRRKEPGRNMVFFGKER